MNPKIKNTDLLEALQWRYATKKFDATKKISENDWQTLQNALILSPSSYGLQPWKFIVLTDPKLREQLVEHSWGQRQVVDGSHYVVMCIKKDLDKNHIAKFIDRTAEVRGVERDKFAGYEGMMISDLVEGPRHAIINEWSSRQVYIALGNLMTCAALMGIDTCPMEGFIPNEYDRILELDKQGLASRVCCVLGYRATDDAYANATKVRFDASQIIERR